MSNAERQRRHRQLLKEKRESEGLRAINLTSTERCVLSLGLLAHEDLDHRGPNWANDKKPEFDALLHKLWPEGDKGRYLAEPQRSTYRPTARLRDNLQDVQERMQRTEQAWRADRDKLNEAEAENLRLKAALAEVEAWGEHYRRQRDGKQAEIENLLGVVGELQQLAEELGGPPMKMARRPTPPPEAPAVGVLDLAQLNEAELELLKSALGEHHEKNKAVLWKDVACENLWRRLSLLQLDKLEPKADPFTLWADDPVWSKAALQAATVEGRQALVEGPSQPEPGVTVTRARRSTR
ncbi:hypothetical protein AB9U01_25135 [Pseudomonas qingdaonensis]|uniref:hypothetical protein n=1 Tax=Pseudomonas qingdaonensis TaxID=2056231 RepID=UPI00351658BC